MTHLDNLVADSLAQSSDTVVHQLASEVVRLRGAITDALRTLYEGGHIYAKPLEDAIRKPAENLFHKSERAAKAWQMACETYLAAHPDADLRRVPAADVVRFGRGGR